MRCASIGSDSKGNALLIENKDTTILLDCGFSFKHLKASLVDLGKTVDDIDAVFVTHEHSDHIAGIKTLSKNTQATIYMSFGTAAASKLLGLPRLNFIVDGGLVRIGTLELRPVTVPHDAREPFQFIIQSHADETNGKSLGVLTDLGSIPPHVAGEYKECDALILEANYDLDMLRGGPYPPSVKNRVGSDWGHLSNQQAADFLRVIDQDKLQWLVAAHVSANNNCVDKVIEEFQTNLSDKEKLHVATQEQGFSWMQVV